MCLPNIRCVDKGFSCLPLWSPTYYTWLSMYDSTCNHMLFTHPVERILNMYKIHISLSVLWTRKWTFKVNSLIVMIWFCNITGGLMSLTSLTGYYYSLFKGQGQAPGYKEIYAKSAIAHLKRALQVLYQPKWNSRHTALWVKEQGTNQGRIKPPTSYGITVVTPLKRQIHVLSNR